MPDVPATAPTIAFVTNICPHYRVRTFEILASHFSTVYYFFSAGEEWYWQQQHGVRSGNFRFHYLPAFRLGRTRVPLGLIGKLCRERCDVFIKCINGRFALPVTYLIARLRRKPFVLWTGIWMRLQTTFHRLAFPLTRYIYRHADAVVVYGDHVKRFLISEGVPAERIFVAHHAVDNDHYARTVSPEELLRLREELRIPAGSRVLLYLGRLEENKGVEYLLHALAHVSSPDAVLVIAGEGSAKPALEMLASTLGVADRVRFCCYVPPEQTSAFYALSYAIVVPSVTTPTSKETWGLVINEAMNQGVPVIASDAVGAAAGGLVRDGANGCIVPERDPQALQVAIEFLLRSPELRDRMSRQARADIAVWDNERMVRGFRDAVAFVLDRSAPASRR